ncbi:MAG TPA: hypothetical protein VKA86_13415 [Candidatus Krumholzibacteria bacterium]|nr:hypothetical protein [Candidatus Krumholzibacteria bacterium]
MSGAESERRRAVLGLLGLAHRAGALRLGAGPVLRALRHEAPGVVLLARDAGKDLAGKIQRARGDSVVDDALLDTDDLAGALGRERLSVVSVHEPGFVSGLKRHLTDSR